MEEDLKEDWQQRLLDRFGVSAPPSALFYQFDAALRIELGGDLAPDPPIRRFEQAAYRATQVANFLFSRAPWPLAFIASWRESQSYDFAPLQKVLGDLASKRPAFSIEEPGQAGSTTNWQVSKIKQQSQIHDLLKLDIAHDLGLQPAASGTKTWLVDFDRAIMLHAYDDRGLDLVAMDKKDLLPAFDRFQSWLLDYDRARMEHIFSRG